MSSVIQKRGKASEISKEKEAQAPWKVIYTHTHTNTHTYKHTHTHIYMGYTDDSVVKNLLTNTEDTGNVGLIPGSEDPLEEEMATCSVFLSGKFHG